MFHKIIVHTKIIKTKQNTQKKQYFSQYIRCNDLRETNNALKSNDEFRTQEIEKMKNSLNKTNAKVSKIHNIFWCEFG